MITANKSLCCLDCKVSGAHNKIIVLHVFSVGGSFQPSASVVYSQSVFSRVLSNWIILFSDKDRIADSDMLGGGYQKVGVTSKHKVP